MSTPTPELRTLVDQLLDGGALGKTEMARLEELLENDENLNYYVQTTQVEGALPEILSQMPSPALPRRRSFPVWPVAWGMAAACAVFFLGLQVGRQGDHPTTPVTSNHHGKSADGPAARITGLMGVRWSSPHQPNLLEKSGSLDKLAIDSGLVEITYASGVKVTVEGPAEFQIADHDSGRLINGKLVACVPNGAEGFRIDYADGTVVDLGTEFAMDVKKGGATEVGVFDGEVELHPNGQSSPMSLFENHAVRHNRHNAQDPIQVVPFKRDHFVRQLPSRDFAWEVNTPGTMELEWDVSHLVWKPADYRAIFKWMNGPQALSIISVELRLDGKLVSRDDHFGRTGTLEVVKDNVYRLKVPEAAHQVGKWVLHAKVRAANTPSNAKAVADPLFCTGILQFEEGLISTATASDFIGKWRYRYAGGDFIREILPDGTIRLYWNGELQTRAFQNGRWIVEEGVLKIYVPHLDLTETHALRDQETMIFIGRPFENARRIRE